MRQGGGRAAEGRAKAKAAARKAKRRMVNLNLPDLHRLLAPLLKLVVLKNKDQREMLRLAEQLEEKMEEAQHETDPDLQEEIAEELFELQDELRAAANKKRAFETMSKEQQYEFQKAAGYIPLRSLVIGVCAFAGVGLVPGCLPGRAGLRWCVRFGPGGPVPLEIWRVAAFFDRPPVRREACSARGLLLAFLETSAP